MSMKSKLALAVLALAAGSAMADAIPYPNPGTQNPVNYTFTASGSGDLVAYFMGSGAGYDEQVGVLVNGVDSGVVGLDDHSSAVGDSIDFGHVNAGDTLVFYDLVLTTGNTFYTDTSMNADGVNHTYSTAYTGGTPGVPAGTYVAFEDLFGGGDLNYFDDTFVFTNVATTPSVPEPANAGLLLAGLGLMAFMVRRRGTK